MPTIPSIESLPTQSVAVDISSASGDQEILPADSGKGYVVLAWVLSSDKPIDLKLKAGATDLTGAMPVAVDTPFEVQEAERGWVHVPAGSALNLNLSASASVGGLIRYVETSS